jgi:N-acetylglucosaminyldiphosphoundecaprenol N-acetyl-beta-D-mannosaminyltransferase
MLKNRKTSHPLGITLDAINTDEFLGKVVSWAHQNIKSYLVTYLNAHCINIYFNDRDYARIVNEADLVYADGQSVVWASRFLGEPLPERVNAGDFFVRFCDVCEKEGLSLYLCGSEEGVAQKTAESIKQRFPRLQIRGFRDGYFKSEEIPQIITTIQKGNPSILLLGMGVPLQEKFAKQHLMNLNIPVVWCVGALFEYFAGRRSRAPKWMRHIGLEWLFRLVLEPRRLWKRYLLGNLSFIFRIIRYRLTRH